MRRQPYDVIDLKALRCFFSVAKHGSLTRAGIELGISEAAVSQRVKALEAYLGTKLYEARGGRVKLTPAGDRAVSLAVTTFDEIEDFERALRAGEETGEVVLSSHDSVLEYLLPDIVERFSRAHPLSRLRLLARPLEETVRLVKGNEADVGIVPNVELPKELVFHPIAKHPAYLLTAKGHPLARRARSDFRSLLNEETIRQFPLIVAEVQLEANVLRQTLARHGLPLNVGLEVGSISTLKQYVARGLGVAVISGLCVTEEDRARLEAIEVSAEVGGESTYGAVIRRDKRRSNLLAELIGLLGVGARART
jgi:DNA-binding transcriptional LysR family regulator